jgi:hypothetical protein
MRGEGEADIIAMADAGVGDAIRIGNKVCGAPNNWDLPKAVRKAVLGNPVNASAARPRYRTCRRPPLPSI